MSLTHCWILITVVVGAAAVVAVVFWGRCLERAMTEADRNPKAEE